LREALEPEVIECDGKCIETIKAFGFRLSDSFQNDRIIRTVINDVVTAEKVIKNRRAQDRKIRLDVHLWLRSKFKRLEMDLPAALDILSNHRNFEIVKIPVEEIAAKGSQVSVCPYGRFHSPLTRLSKQVRCCLSVGGEPLVNLDIANSQPLFLGLLVMNYRKQGNKLFGFQTFKQNVVDPYKDIDAIIERTITPFIFNKEYSSTYLSSTAITNRKAIEEETETQYLQTLTTTTSCPQENTLIKKHLQQDEVRYLELCQQGQLYQYLAKFVDASSRQRLKKNFFGVLFSKNSFSSPLKCIFNQEFPNVAEVIREHKRKDYKFLARLLQLYESNLMINHVVRRIRIEMPEAPIYTIHDSILTTRQYVDQVNDIMKAEFASLGLSPSIRLEDYGATAEIDSERLIEPSMANVEGGLGLQSTC